MDFVKPTVAIYINDARIMKLYRTSGPNAIKISGENTGITLYLITLFLSESTVVLSM